MSLESVFLKNHVLANRIRELGFDLDSLTFMCKDLFDVLNDLQLSSLDLIDFITNLKVAQDKKLGKNCLDENNDVPLKITVTNTLNHRTVYFTLCPTNSGAAKYSCEICTATLSKVEIKKHVIDHETSMGYH